MPEGEAMERATLAVMRIAQDEGCHEQFLEARRALEAMGVSRECLIEFTRASFAEMTRAGDPGIGAEELDIIAEAKTTGFMWLMDNV